MRRWRFCRYFWHFFVCLGLTRGKLLRCCHINFLFRLWLFSWRRLFTMVWRLDKLCLWVDAKLLSLWGIIWPLFLTARIYILIYGMLFILALQRNELLWLTSQFYHHVSWLRILIRYGVSNFLNLLLFLWVMSRYLMSGVLWDNWSFCKFFCRFLKSRLMLYNCWIDWLWLLR